MARVARQPRELAPNLAGETASLAVRAKALVGATKGMAAHVAQTVAHAVTAAWWDEMIDRAGGTRNRLPLAPFAGSLLELPPDILEEAQSLGRAVAAPLAAEACAALGRIYTGALPDEKRAAEGIYYTAPALVCRLLDKAERAGHDWRTMSAIDPSCGGGAFLVEGALRMAGVMRNADPAILLAAVGARLRGWDIDPFGCWLAQTAVEGALLPQVLASGKRVPQITECRDALKTFRKDIGCYDLVMGNPAFGKTKKTEEMGRAFARSLFGHPNLYGMLTDVAVHLAKPDGGLVAYLTPTSYLGGEYFKNLRKLIWYEAPPVSVDIVESRDDVFTDVLQEVSLTCLKRGRREHHAACSVIHVEPAGLSIVETGNLVLPTQPTAPWIIPRSPDDAGLVTKLAGLPTRLRDWGYRVATGPLVWNRHKERLYAEPGPDRYPVIWAEAVTSDGRFSLQAAKTNHRDKAWFKPARKNDPNLVRQACVLAQRTTAKEQDRRLICAVMAPGVIKEHGAVAVENHLNMFVPTTTKPEVPPKLLAAFLSTSAADRVIRCINGSVALSASELEAMPLPSADDLTTAMSSRDPESAVRRLYGIADAVAADTAAGGHP